MEKKVLSLLLRLQPAFKVLFSPFFNFCLEIGLAWKFPYFEEKKG